MEKIKVLLIEDNRLLREGTAALLNEQADFKVVSCSGNRGALEKAKELVPDVVLLDVGLKSRDSLKVLESIRQQHPRTEVVVMDLIPSHSEMIEFVKAGVSGFVPKDASLDEFLSTIRAVVRGVKVLPPTMADSLLSHIVEQAIQAGTVDRVIAAIKLTKQEQAVIDLLGQGKSIRQTSLRLKVAASTVKSHVRRILDKFALHTRLELATFAHAKALTETDSDRP
jgi:DNA-binding NarL/FixJ family response regulator